MSTRLKLVILYSTIGVTLCILLLVFIFIKSRVSNNTSNHNQNSVNATPTSNPIVENFSISSVSPTENATIDPTEIQISFITNTPLTTSNDFSFIISPALSFGYQDKSTYPTNNVVLQVLGGLSANTTYTVTIKNSEQNVVKTWSFQTSNKQNPGSSGLEKQKETQQINSDYPLFNYIPYTSNDFTADYSGINTLKVTVVNTSLSLSQVEQEVQAWIQSHNVDPNTQTINYYDSNNNQLDTKPASK